MHVGNLVGDLIGVLIGVIVGVLIKVLVGVLVEGGGKLQSEDMSVLEGQAAANALAERTRCIWSMSLCWRSCG